MATGELDLSTAPLLEEALAAAEATDATPIILDIDAVSFIDSTGLRALLEAHARSQQNGNRLRFTRGSDQAKRLFTLAAIDDVLPFVES